MTVSEVISSGLLESYVLGSTTVEENELVQNLFRQYPELLKEVEAIENDLIHLSESTQHPVNSKLKEKIAAQLNFKETETAKVVPLNTNTNSLKFYQFALAASTVLFVTSFVYNVFLQQRLNRANGELADLNTSKSVMADAMKVQQASLKTISEQFQIVVNPNMKTVALNGMNTLANHSALIHWNTKTDEVYFDASQLPASPSNKQYQLWAMVAGKPVDAGMIDLSNPNFIFQKMKAIQGAQAFAVTIEQVGGSAAPTLETMCLLGNV